MNVNGITTPFTTDAYELSTTAVKAADKTAPKQEDAAVFEKSAAAAEAKYAPDLNLVQMLKDDAAAREASFRSMVQKSILGQGNALAASDDFWKFLASGNFTVTAAAREEAQKAISEDGYWGVNKTSDRIIEMAKALTGGDPSKIEEMRSAFVKGFNEATKTWGKELPDISGRTYNAVMEKFDKWAEKTATN